MSVLHIGRKIADTVLYEGYLLYPYSARATKNQVRWQFGVVVPRAYSESGNGEPWRMQTEALFETGGEAQCEVVVRFLHVQTRTVEKCEGDSFEPVESLSVNGTEYISWDEAVEREVLYTFPALLDTVTQVQIDVPESTTMETLRGSDGATRGRITRRCAPLRGTLTLSVEPAGEVHKVRIEIENHSDVDTQGGELSSVPRAIALRTSFISTHTLMALENGLFLSLLDPPNYVVHLAKTCSNQHTWP
ncbi:MAG: hypothetical protein M3160_08705, partial [Candidatus Eremiobacteraeota bacterium]|nr:hypothetical protein [Candidatus Eremiobacteraeota bacterium]